MGTLTAGIKEIFSSAKTTGSNVMLCGNDGTPDGHMTMANLANVLGVEKDVGYIDESYSNDANNFKGRTLLGMTDQNTLNIPSNVYGFLINFDCGGTQYPGFGVQIWFKSTSLDHIYFRGFWNSWQEWHAVSST